MPLQAGRAVGRDATPVGRRGRGTGHRRRGTSSPGWLVWQDSTGSPGVAWSCDCHGPAGGDISAAAPLCQIANYYLTESGSLAALCFPSPSSRLTSAVIAAATSVTAAGFHIFVEHIFVEHPTVSDRFVLQVAMATGDAALLVRSGR